MLELLDRFPPIDRALVVAVALTGVISLVTGRRGGHFRGLPGWSGFWILFGLLLVLLSRGQRWISFPLLGALMFASTRAYYFLAPVRPRDRYVILASYLTIPFALWFPFTGETDTFMATVPVVLFLFIPVFISLAKAGEGLLDSMGRAMLGVAFFVFGLAHLGLLANAEQNGLPELFGILVLAADLPQRLSGRFGPGQPFLRPALGVLIGGGLAVALGWTLGPWCGLVEEDGARAGALVAVAVTLGALVGEAVARDLSLTSSSARIGRGAYISRLVPAVYAAPVFFHYIRHFVP